MSFYVLTCIGIAVGLLHIVLPGEHRVGAASAIVLGIVAAWGGALLAAAFRKGGWIELGPIALAGAILGAVGTVAAAERAAAAYVRSET